MKKIALFVATLAIVGMTMTSCDKEAERCWKFNYKAEVAGAKVDVTTYEWLSENDAAAKEEMLEKELNVDVKRSRSANKTAEDCAAANIEDINAKCWKFVYKAEIAGIKTEVTTYEWLTKDAAKAQEELLEKNLGVDVTRSVSMHKNAEDCAEANK